MFSYHVYAQAKRVLVKDYDNKKELSKISVKDCLGRSLGQTDGQGVFALVDNLNTDCLIFQAVGYKSDTLATKGLDERSTILWLRPLVREIEEVLVSTGYQTIPRERATGSFDLISGKRLEQQITENILDKIDGASPAVLFDRRNGMTTSFMVRGLSTLESSIKKPLIVVDNFPYEGELTDINPNDVDNITILKDAAASSIWGAKAGNGVLVITLKKSTFKSPYTLSLTSNFSVTEKEDLFYKPQVDNKTYIGMERFLFGQGYYNSNLNNKTTYPVLSPVVELLSRHKAGAMTDEQLEVELEEISKGDLRADMSKYLRQTATNQQYNLRLSSGSEHSSSMLSVGYDKARATLVGNANMRLTVRAQQQWRPLKHLNIDASLNYVATKSEDNGISALRPSPTGTLPPYTRLVDEEGNPARIMQTYRAGFIDTVGQGKLLDWTYYPLKDRDLMDKFSDGKSLVADFAARYTWFKGLTTELRYQYNYQQNKSEQLWGEESFYARDFINKFTNLKGETVTRNVPLGGIMQRDHRLGTGYNLRGQINYNGTIGDGGLSVLLGGEFRSHTSLSDAFRLYGYDTELLLAQPVDYITKLPYYGKLGSGGNIQNFEKDRRGNNRFVSAYFNGAYAWKDRYTLSLSARRDASNIFGVSTNNRWKPLWSVGGLYNLYKESFYRWQAVPELSLRLTYGHSGNVNNSIPAQTTLEYSAFPSSTAKFINAMVKTPPNADLRWENVAQINAAMEFALKGKKIRGRIEYFNKEASDLLTPIQVDPTLGMSSVTKNAARLETKGWEATINTVNIAKAFRWETQWNYSFQKSVVQEFFFERTNVATMVGPGSGLLPIEGRSAYNVVSYKFMGLDPETGDPLVSVAGNASKDYKTMANNIVLSDLVFHGTPIPEHFGTMRNVFSYKNWSLSVLLAYRLNFFFMRETVNSSGFVDGTPAHADYYDRWQQAGDELRTTVPSFVYPIVSNRDHTYANSDVLVERADNIALQDLNLNYSLQSRSSKFRRITLQAHVRNVAIIWKHTKTKQDPNTKGAPIPMTLSMGLNFEF